MAKKLVIYGASNPCVLKILGAVNRAVPVWELVGFVDDTPEKAGQDFHGHRVLGSREIIPTLDPESTFFFNNVFGSMPARRQVAEVLKGFNCTLISLISPDVDTYFSWIGLDVAIEEKATMDVGVRIGDHGCVKRSASIGHETTAEEFVFIGPGATLCGRIAIGAGAYIGAGAVVRDGLVIGEDSTVGMGAVVVRDVPPGSTVLGNPARVVNR